LVIFLAVLPLSIYLVQQNQENRSNAASNSEDNIGKDYGDSIAIKTGSECQMSGGVCVANEKICTDNGNSVIVSADCDNTSQICCTSTEDDQTAKKIINKSDSSNTSTTDPIVPTKNIKYRADSNSLKIWVEYKKSDYYAVHIWAQNPYQQLKKFTFDDAGQKYAKLNSIVKNLISSNLIKDKIAVAFNNDIHVNHNAYYNNSKYWKTYTGTGLVLINGKIARNDPKSPSKRMIISGITKDNILKLFAEDNNPNPDKNTSIKIAGRTNLYQSIIDNGVQNSISTFGYYVEIGQISSRAKDKKNQGHGLRQVICQINSNNFIQITTAKGYTPLEAAKLAKNLGCVTAIEMDGGFSALLYYKDKSTTNWTKKLVTKGEDQIKMWSVMYWTEL
jgi:hypothetical protein